MSDMLTRAEIRYRPLSLALRAALRGDPFYDGLEARARDDAGHAMLRYFDISCLDAERHGMLTAWQGDVMGAALWARPGAPPEARALKSALLENTLGPEAVALYKRVAASMGRLSAPHVTDSDWYLSILGLAPAHRGQGLGAGLVAPGLEAADRAGIATYLETFTPGNIGFYRKLGYTEVARCEEPVLGVGYHVLRRLPARG